MKRLHAIAWFLLLIACIVGGLILEGVVSEARLRSLPGWLRFILACCILASGINVLAGWIYDYRKRRYKVPEHDATSRGHNNEKASA